MVFDFEYVELSEDEGEEEGEDNWEKTRAMRLTRSSEVSLETTWSTSFADKMSVDIVL